MAKLILFAAICLLSLFSPMAMAEDAIIPRNLDEAISALDTIWSEEDKEWFKNTEEANAVAECHMGAGLWMRNAWIRSKVDTSLRDYFDSLGVHSPDDMSGIILTSFHRKLNNKDIDLKEQVQRSREYWQCVMESKQKAIEDYGKYKIGDKVRIFMQVIKDKESLRTVYHSCLRFADGFKKIMEFEIDCKIVGKYLQGDSTEGYFNLIIENKNLDSISIGEFVPVIGDTLELKIRNLRFEPVE